MPDAVGYPGSSHRCNVSNPKTITKSNHGANPSSSVFFIISALTELALGRHRKKEQRFGPSPANNYTSGYGSTRKRGLFGLRRNKRADTDGLGDPNALPMHTSPDQVRTSYNTEATRVGEGSPYNKYGEAGYNEHGTATHANTGRYGDGTYNV